MTETKKSPATVGAATEQKEISVTEYSNTICENCQARMRKNLEEIAAIIDRTGRRGEQCVEFGMGVAYGMLKSLINSIPCAEEADADDQRVL